MSNYKNLQSYSGVAFAYLKGNSINLSYFEVIINKKNNTNKKQRVPSLKNLGAGLRSVAAVDFPMAPEKCQQVCQVPVLPRCWLEVISSGTRAAGLREPRLGAPASLRRKRTPLVPHLFIDVEFLKALRQS